ncbi:MAG: hypothetical protein N2690_01780 [Rhodocyclaceae bacterium]|nr:hypothetical protein [Rhodocyclaceae bacterium]
MSALDELLERALDIAQAQRRAEAAALAALIDARAFERVARGQTSRQIADATGLPHDDVRLALAVLAHQGLVEGGAVYWRITPAGLAAFPHLCKE